LSQLASDSSSEAETTDLVVGDVTLTVERNVEVDTVEMREIRFTGRGTREKERGN